MALTNLQHGTIKSLTPLKSILKTSASFAVAEKQRDSKDKCQKRQRWDEGNILETSCHPLLKRSGNKASKPGAHLCSDSMLENVAGTTGAQTRPCVSKRKKKQNRKEGSIEVTQPHKTKVWTTSEDGASIGMTWYTSKCYLVENDSSDPIQVSFSNWDQPENTLDPGQFVDKDDTVQNQNRQEGIASGRKDFSKKPSFEELRKAHFRESREVLQASKSRASAKDEEEAEESNVSHRTAPS